MYVNDDSSFKTSRQFAWLVSPMLNVWSCAQWMRPREPGWNFTLGSILCTSLYTWSSAGKQNSYETATKPCAGPRKPLLWMSSRLNFILLDVCHWAGFCWAWELQLATMLTMKMSRVIFKKDKFMLIDFTAEKCTRVNSCFKSSFTLTRYLNSRQT